MTVLLEYILCLDYSNLAIYRYLMMGECRSVIGLFLLFTLHLSQAAVKVQQQTVVGLVRQVSTKFINS